ncbi:MAG: fructosamine kinase family protein [Deltaproteobacteria bacterium]
MTLQARVEAALSRALGRSVHVRDQSQLGGGCINEAARIDTDAGTFFLKSNATPSAIFSAEAAGLEAMRAAATSLVIPEVIAFEDPVAGAAGFLVTTYLEPGRRTADFDEVLGRGLAELHGATRRTYGFEIDTYCGLTLQPNAATSGWVEFYREHRLGYQLREGVQAGIYSRGDAKRIERLLSRLDELLVEHPPALIHGDLWSGNLHADGARPALIDPAVAYAHPEAELGMMTLFGGFSARTYDAYAEVRPLDGWRARNALYQLYHVMNHALLFGGGYVGQAMGIVGRYV